MNEAKFKAPSFNELLLRIPDRNQMDAAQLTAAIAQEEAQDVFRHLAELSSLRSSSES